MEIILILLLAIIIDLVVGEPPRPIHPVVWMGKVISFMEKHSFVRGPRAQFIYGIGMVVVTLAFFVIPAFLVLHYLKDINTAGYVIAGAVLLKPAFSLRELRRAALGIRKRLAEDKLDDARFELRSLVSRDTRGLSKPLLVSAAVESVAESTVDSFIAPLFYFLLLGVPGAIAYRVVNTLDAMIGYHGKYEYLGKPAGRLDDILNYIPARLTALLLVLVTFLSRKNGRSAWRVAVNEHTRTESPNAGWPIAAAAGALDVQLEKVGYYKLGQANAPLVPETIDASLRLGQTTMLSWIIICLLVGVIHIVLTT